MDKLRHEWSNAGRDLETGSLAGTCTIPGCRTMPFVTLRTETGRRPLCLRHFEVLGTEAA